MITKTTIKYILKTILLLVFFILSSYNVYALDFGYESSATLIKKGNKPYFDHRVIILKNYFNSHNSPLADYAYTFVKKADEYNLDWRLVPAITGVESTFGKRIPYNSYNAYGWNNGNYYFDSWENSIDHVSKIIKENYVDDGLKNIDQIARRYAASPDWAWKVKYFQNKIDPLPFEFTL